MPTITAIILTRCFARKRSTCTLWIQRKRMQQKSTYNLIKMPTAEQTRSWQQTWQRSGDWSELSLFWTWREEQEPGQHFAALIIYKAVYFLRIANSCFTTMRKKKIVNLKILIHPKSWYANFPSLFSSIFLIERLLSALCCLSSFNPFQKYLCSTKHCRWSH